MTNTKVKPATKRPRKIAGEPKAELSGQDSTAASASTNVDVIVVCKVDRLNRSLADFAKIVDHLDARRASFVSVAQAFNTTTSMGRLTLNVLLKGSVGS